MRDTAVHVARVTRGHQAVNSRSQRHDSRDNLRCTIDVVDYDYTSIEDLHRARIVLLSMLMVGY